VTPNRVLLRELRYERGICSYALQSKTLATIEEVLALTPVELGCAN